MFLNRPLKLISTLIDLVVLTFILGCDLPQRITSEVDGAEMVLIPAGSFEMGDAMNEPEVWMENARPAHRVELDGFYMDAYEVTVEQYKKFNY